MKRTEAAASPPPEMVKFAASLVDGIYAYLKRHKVEIVEAQVKVSDSRLYRCLTVRLNDVFPDKPELHNTVVNFWDYIDPNARADFQRVKRPNGYVNFIRVFGYPKPLSQEDVINHRSELGRNPKRSLFHELIHLLQILDPDSTLFDLYKKLSQNATHLLNNKNYYDQDWEIEAHTLTAVYGLIEDKGSIEAALAAFPTKELFFIEVEKRLNAQVKAYSIIDNASPKARSATAKRVRQILSGFFVDLKKIKVATKDPESSVYVRYRYKGERKFTFLNRSTKVIIAPGTKYGVVVPDKMKKIKARLVIDGDDTVYKLDQKDIAKLLKFSTKLKPKGT